MQTNYLCSTKKSIKNIDIKQASSEVLSLKNDILVIVDNNDWRYFPIQLAAQDLPSLTWFNVWFWKSRLLFIVVNPSAEIRYVPTPERIIWDAIPAINYPNSDYKLTEFMIGAIDIHNASVDTDFTGWTTALDETDITFSIYENINSDTDTIA